LFKAEAFPHTPATVHAALISSGTRLILVNYLALIPEPFAMPLIS